MTAPSQPAEWLGFAATPTFALMAVFHTIPASGVHHMSCSATTHMAPLGGMAAMYLLMGAFHSPPWLKLAGRWRSSVGHRRARQAVLD